MEEAGEEVGLGFSRGTFQGQGSAPQARAYTLMIDYALGGCRWAAERLVQQRSLLARWRTAREG